MGITCGFSATHSSFTGPSRRLAPERASSKAGSSSSSCRRRRPPHQSRDRSHRSSPARRSGRAVRRRLDRVAHNSVPAVERTFSHVRQTLGRRRSVLTRFRIHGVRRTQPLIRGVRRRLFPIRDAHRLFPIRGAHRRRRRRLDRAAHNSGRAAGPISSRVQRKSDRVAPALDPCVSRGPFPS